MTWSTLRPLLIEHGIIESDLIIAVAAARELAGFCWAIATD